MTIKKLDAIVQNYLNGNLSDAKKAAQKTTARAMYRHLIAEWAYSTDAASAVADYLCNGGDYQKAADEEFRMREDRKPHKILA